MRPQSNAEPADISRDPPASDASATDASGTSGEPASPFCGHCGRRADMSAIGAQVGLCHCPYCRSYSCRWCWADASGDCPECGFGYEEMAIAAVLAAGRPPVPPRFGERWLFAAASLVVVIALLAFSVGGGFPSMAGFGRGSSPTGGGGQSGGLAAVGSSSSSPMVTAGPSGSGTTDPSATASPRSNGSGAVAGETSPPHGVPTPTPTSPPGATPTPVATPTRTPTGTPRLTPPPTSTPTPAPTPNPTPRPTPTPRATPTPTPSCQTVPKLVGLSVAAARAAWTGAGFTGTFIPLRGHDLAIVQSQTPTAGGCLPATTSVTVTWK